MKTVRRQLIDYKDLNWNGQNDIHYIWVIGNSNKKRKRGALCYSVEERKVIVP